MLCVQQLAGSHGHFSPSTLLMAGLAVHTLTGALTGLLVFVANDAQIRNITFWMLGSLGNATWTSALAVLPCVALAMAGLLRSARPLNLLLLGEREAQHLGVDVARLKRHILFFAALAVGAAVAFCGVIGFVGLMVPHVLRLWLGPDQRRVLPGSALLGACLLLVADLLARTVVSPAELPIGIVTALMGAPFFLWLLRHKAYA